MKNKKTMIAIAAVLVLGIGAFVFHPSNSQAARYGNLSVQRNLSVESHKSDAILVSESYERLLGFYMNTMEKRMDISDGGMIQIHEKLDMIDKKIDDIGARLTSIENALNITEEIPQPESK